jgi:PAS domain-containing protein
LIQFIKNTFGNFFSADQNLQQINALSEKLKLSDQKFDWLTRASNEAIRECDLQSGVMAWNHGLLRLFGYSDNQNVNYDAWLSMIHPADLNNVVNDITRAFASNQLTWSCKYSMKCANESYKFIFDQVFIVYIEKVPIQMIGVMQDMEERLW